MATSYASMEIVALLKSWDNDIRAYAKTRLLLPRMAALLMLVLLAAWCHSVPQSLPQTWLEAGLDTGLAALLLAQFRIWDDLVDVPLDRRVKPNRVLCTTTFRGAFIGLVVALAAGSVALLVSLTNLAALALLGGLTVLMICWYLIPSRSTWTGANYHVVLLKYPAFILLLASRAESLSVPASSLRTAFAVYLLLCVFEVCHDHLLRGRTRFRLLAGVEALLLMVSVSLAITTGAVP